MQDPKKRATADEILRHSWMKENGTASDKPLDNVILTRMRGFMNMNKLKKEALKVIAGGMSPEEIAGLRSLFQVLGTAALEDTAVSFFELIRHGQERDSDTGETLAFWMVSFIRPCKLMSSL